MENSDLFEHKRTEIETNQNSNVFVIMRYRKDSPLVKIEAAIRDTLKTYRLTAVLAKDVIVDLDQDLWRNVRFCMDHCIFAIAVFDRLIEPDYSPNVALEVGYMLALRRPCLILKDKALPSLPSDIIGRLYWEFDSHNAAQTIGNAVSSWLEKSGYTSVQPAETITGRTANQARKKRTSRIIESLKAAYKEPPIEQSYRLIRQAASISSLAISDSEKHKDKDYHSLLLEERDNILNLLNDGWIVRIILCPDSQLEWAELHQVSKNFVKSHAYPRFEQFAELITSNLENSNLQVVYTLRLPHENVLIVGTSVVFVGRRRRYQFGFPYTTIIHDPSIIRDEIAEFDMLFGDSAALILGKNPNSNVEQYFDSQELKQKVLKKLTRSKKRLQELLAENNKDNSI